MKPRPITLAPGEQLMTIDQVGELLQIPVKTLRDWRYRGEGPSAMRVGNHLRYVRADVESFLNSLRGAA